MGPCQCLDSGCGWCHVGAWILDDLLLIGAWIVNGAVSVPG